MSDVIGSTVRLGSSRKDAFMTMMVEAVQFRYPDHFGLNMEVPETRNVVSKCENAILS
jgi:hypothetical protein